jgi:uncharacterized membrane protein YbhN (UPF0104 family)
MGGRYAEIPPKPRSKGARILSWAGTALGVCLFVAAIWIFGRILRSYDLAEVIQHFEEIPAGRIATAVAFVFLSYFAQTLYDYLSALSVGLRIAPAKACLAAFIGNAFTNNIGFSLVTGTSIRYRFYLAWGFSPLEIAHLIAMTKLAFCNGLFLFAGISQILDPIRLPESISLPFSPRTLGWLLILPSVVLLVWNGLSRGSILSFGRFRMVRPPESLLIMQTVFSCLQFALASCVLYFLLPPDALRAAGYHGPLTFMGAFMAIKFVVMFIPVPGSLGVFEGAAVTVLTPALPDYPVLGALFAYRLLYYVLPFAIALPTFLAYELSSRKGLLASLLRRRRRARGLA